ncbi:MAG: hydroxymethylbilane synthase [Peptococcaceae bacterium]|jgi:hydroxymethylbilane synthase|nr:hydroxymethylbilane synthase [Peptococcaceae bacterium]
MNSIRIGTRDSVLALWQAEYVKQQLQSQRRDLDVQLTPMKTQGDKILDVALAKIGDKGLFTKELEYGLLQGEIDMAVHSLKDLPTLLPPSLEIAAFCKREEPRDVFLSKDGVCLLNLPKGALVGTGSLRRAAQLRHIRPDLTLTDLRGNLQTRWNKLQESAMQGIVLAAAGVKRLGWQERITEILPLEMILPAVGQGVIAVEISAERSDIRELLSAINHPPTELAVRAERALMRILGGGCQTPIGALATLCGAEISLVGMIASLDGTQILRASTRGHDPEKVGETAGQSLMAQGASGILAALRDEEKYCNRIVAMTDRSKT